MTEGDRPPAYAPEHEIRRDMLGRTVENVLHEVDQANGIDRITLELRLPHFRSHTPARAEMLAVVVEGRRDRGLSLRSAHV
jgi:hypothetical protein